MEYLVISEQTGWVVISGGLNRRKACTVYIVGLDDADAMACVLGGVPPPGSCKDPRVRFVETVGVEDGAKVTLDVLKNIANDRIKELIDRYKEKK